MTNTIIDTTSSEELEGLDSTSSAAWGEEYPLDSVFVRTEQRAAAPMIT